MKIVGTALMALGLLLLSGCTPQTASITDEDLVGTWKELATPHLLRFNEDGTYRFAISSASLDDNPEELGQFMLEGTTLTFITNEESHGICAGLNGIYDLQLTEQGWLGLSLREDACGDRARFYDGSTWHPVSP